MEYITGIFALNIECELETCGDWHCSALDWDNMKFLNTEESFYENYGIEFKDRIISGYKNVYVANHIRALLDLLLESKFSIAQGMNRDFIGNEKYDKEIFNKVYEMRNQKNWKEVNKFMEKEYLMKWINFINNEDDDKKMHNKLKLDDGGRRKHKEVMSEFLQYLNIKNDRYVLKGGTALMMCYELDRFSEGIDLDSTDSRSIKKIVESFCNEKNINIH